MTPRPAPRRKVAVVNRIFGTMPLVAHCNGPMQNRLAWPRIRDAVFAGPRLNLGPIPGLTLLTCNNGNGAMGLLERSAEMLGVPCMVRGMGIAPWMNSRDKPKVIAGALHEIATEYVMYIDSRDAVLLGDPRPVIAAVESRPGCKLLFGGDRVSWPAVNEFMAFESSLPGAAASEFRYLNGGAWVGRTRFCEEFFLEAMRTPPLTIAPETEQGILRQLLPRYYPAAQIDYRCEVFQNLGLLFTDILDVLPSPSPSVDAAEIHQ